MNYFQMFGLPESLDMDREELLHKYLEVNKRLKSEKLGFDATDVNLAYRTLYDKFERLKYFLELKQISFETEDVKISDEFLEEVADYRFKMGSAVDINEKDRIRKRIEQKTDFLFEQMKGAFIKGQKDLIMSIFIKIKYLSKIISDVKK